MMPGRRSKDLSLNAVIENVHTIAIDETLVRDGVTLLGFRPRIATWP
jgi:hypothetical protein